MEFGSLFDGKYRIIRLLGSGGSGRVYLAENIRVKSLWAIKEIPCGDIGAEQIEREIEVLKKIRHPALPRVVDVLREDGAVYLIEDFFEGRNVDEILRKQERVEVGVALRWARDISGIMEFLHSQKPEPIIYRDLKPSNIILSPEGAVRLVDFGSVRRYKSENDSDTVYIGTRGYAAPEQYGLGQTSIQSDVYSFGVTMLQVLTGKRPMRAIAGQGADGGVSDIVRYYIDKDCPGQVAEIIHAVFAKCVNEDPKRRYRSFSEINCELDRRPELAGFGEDAGKVSEAAPAGPGKINAIERPFAAADNTGALFENAGGVTTLLEVSARRSDDISRRNEDKGAQISEDKQGFYGAPERKTARNAAASARREKPEYREQRANPANGDYPTGIFRCATISVAQNHEFAFELAHRAAEGYGLRALILDFCFEKTPSEWYFQPESSNGYKKGGNSLLSAIELVERASAPRGAAAPYGSAMSYNEAPPYGSAPSYNEVPSYGSAMSYGAQENPVSDIYYQKREPPAPQTFNENIFANMNELSRISRGRDKTPAPIWFNEPDPEHSGRAADILLCDRGRAFRRLLTEITVYADVCVLLTGNSAFDEMNCLCFQNSHFIIYPGGSELPSVRAFNNAARLFERGRGVSSGRFKYVIWDYQYKDDIKHDIMTELTEESLAGVVRRSGRRDGAKRDGVFRKCYARAMEKEVKKDYDDILFTLGVVVTE